jgi:glutaredoxin
MYEIYTKPACVRCEEVKAIFIAKKIFYKEYIVGEDFSVAEIKEKFPRINLLPIILKDGKRITTIDELRETLEETNIIRFDRKL